ncbi:hypothetical protein H0E86_21695 [Streptomyces sp. SCSIO-PteL053]|nr:hypothetical protein H0E86_21695 [Streptomyces sp. SCSIO-PteL053]
MTTFAPDGAYTDTYAATSSPLPVIPTVRSSPAVAAKTPRARWPDRASRRGTDGPSADKATDTSADSVRSRLPVFPPYGSITTR